MKKIAIKAFDAIAFTLFVASLVLAIPFLICMELIWNWYVEMHKNNGLFKFKKITFSQIIKAYRQSAGEMDKVSRATE